MRKNNKKRRNNKRKRKTVNENETRHTYCENNLHHKIITAYTGMLCVFLYHTPFRDGSLSGKMYVWLIGFQIGMCPGLLLQNS